MKVNAVAALCRERGIGYNNQLPWKLKKELKYFLKITKHTNSPNMKNAILMGRKTWDSINNRPLPGRINVVLTTKPDELKSKVPAEVLVYDNFNTAVEEVGKIEEVETLWVVGGSFIYKEAMKHPSINRLHITEIDADFKCDVFFPEYKNDFKMIEDHGEDSHLVPMEKQIEDGIEYYYRIYEKK